MLFDLFKKPEVVYKTTTPVSGKVEVVDFRGERLLKVNGYTQSSFPLKEDWGRYDNRYWGQAVKLREKYLTAPIENVLLLGLAGGTMVHLLCQKYPEAKLTAVDLDQEVVGIGRKYFGIGRYKNLEVEFCEAGRWLAENAEKKFDFVAVDLFCGGNFGGALSPDFLARLAKVSSGVAILNQIFPTKKDQQEAVEKLKTVFKNVSAHRIPPGNVLVVAH